MSNVKKFISFTLCLVIILSISASAFATSPDSSEISPPCSADILHQWKQCQFQIGSKHSLLIWRLCELSGTLPA